MSEITISKATLAAAYVQARSEFGVSTEADFALTRTSAKGKVTVRTALGVVMSGNKVEREKYAQHLALETWVTGRLVPLSQELRRVFPKLEKTISETNAAINQVLKDNPELSDKLRLINYEKPAKADIGKMFDLAAGLAGADKGEKAKMLAAGQAINAYELRVREIAREMAALENKAAA